MARSPYEGLIPCPAGTEVAVLRSEHSCCAGTPQWVGGRTSRPVIR